MFLGVGFGEVVLLLLIFLIFVGPERLPLVARRMACLLRELRYQIDLLRDGLREQMGFLLSSESKRKRKSGFSESPSVVSDDPEVEDPSAYDDV